MSTCAEAIRAMEKKPKPPRPDLAFKGFYSSRAWRSARYAFLKVQPRPLRCKCCGATAAHVRLVVDHILAVKKDWSRRLDQANLQLLCDDCDSTDWRTSYE
jgi:hypothetical protein